MTSLIHEADRPRKPWRVDWRERGRSRTRRFSTRREAVIFQGDVERGVAASVERLVLSVWLERWLRTHGMAWEPRTRRDRGDYIDRLIAPELGKMRLDRIGRPDVRDWRGRMVAQGSSAYTANRAVSILSAALGAAVDDDLIPANPCRGLKPLPREKVVRRRPAALSEVEAIRAAMSAPADRAMVSLMAYAGLRPSEARALQWADVSTKTLVVRAAISGEGREKTTKTGSVRSVPILAPLRDDLETLERGETPLLGIPVDHRNWTKRVWRPARDAAKSSATPYALRHTFASLQIAAGRNPWQVAALMGHANPQMVIAVYGHLFSEAELAEPQPIEPAVEKARHEASISRATRAK